MPSSTRRYNPYLLAGNRVTTALRKPGAAQDGQAPVWDNAAKKFKPGASGGGGGSNPYKGDWAPVGTYPVGSDKAGQIWRLYPGGDLLPDGENYPESSLMISTIDNADANTSAHWRVIS